MNPVAQSTAPVLPGAATATLANIIFPPIAQTMLMTIALRRLLLRRCKARRAATT